MPGDLQAAKTFADDILTLLHPHLEEGPYTGVGYSCAPRINPKAREELVNLLHKAQVPELSEKQQARLKEGELWHWEQR